MPPVAAPPFRDLLPAGATPPFPLREPPPEVAAPARRSLLDRWNRLPATLQRLLVGGVAVAIAVGLLLIPEAQSVEVIRVESPASPPIRTNEVSLRPVPLPVEFPLPSWYVAVAPVDRNTRVTADNLTVLFRVQPGKPVPPNAITNPNALVGKYALRAISANTIVTPADFSDTPIPNRVVVFLSVTAKTGVTKVPFEKLPDGELIRLRDDDPAVRATVEAERKAREAAVPPEEVLRGAR